MKESINLSLRLLIISFVAALALAATHAITKEPIAQKDLEIATQARQSVIDADDFEKIDLNALKKDSAWSDSFDGVKNIYIAKAGGQEVGVTIELGHKGYGGEIVMTVGITKDGKVSGVMVNSHSETAALGSKATEESYTDQFKGKSAENPIAATASGTGNDVEVVSGATVSSNAVADGVNTAGEVALLAMGGEAK